MKAVEIRSFGFEGLTLVEREEPGAPGRGQVLVRMRAASLNARDLMTARGEYNPRQPLPLVPCSDGVGEVVAAGDGVTRVSEGDRVLPIFAQAWLHGGLNRETRRSTLGGPLDGTLAELRTFDERGLVQAPAQLSDEEAACLPCAAVTAWNAVVSHGGVGPGDVVLVQGTGGVSVFAIQFAGMLGARVVVTSSDDAKLERALQLGAWQAINYRETPDWGKQARELSGGEGVDLVVEVGGAGTLEQSLAAVRFGGRIALIGVLAGGAGKLNIIPVFMQNVRIQGIFVGSRDDFETMNRAINAHGLLPVVDRVFDLAETREAMEHMTRGAHFGKIAIRI